MVRHHYGSRCGVEPTIREDICDVIPDGLCLPIAAGSDLGGDEEESRQAIILFTPSEDVYLVVFGTRWRRGGSVNFPVFK